MPSLNDPFAARHARMFEFLRQSQQAELTSERLAEKAMPLKDRQVPEDWCASAIQSLRFDAPLAG